VWASMHAARSPELTGILWLWKDAAPAFSQERMGTSGRMTMITQAQRVVIIGRRAAFTEARPADRPGQLYASATSSLLITPKDARQPLAVSHP
jgi:hypothetical protein